MVGECRNILHMNRMLYYVVRYVRLFSSIGDPRQVLETYKPHILSRRRRLIEDCVRDLRLNNDHIHIVEQEMRKSIEVSGERQLFDYREDSTININFSFLPLLQKGLSKEGHQAASVKCYPTYVRRLPNGKEQGKFLSLDLGGTNFRVIVMELTSDQEFLMDSKIYAIPNAVMKGTGEQLFDHIAECLADFVKDREIDHEILPLGFTFSFPCYQARMLVEYLLLKIKKEYC